MNQLTGIITACEINVLLTNYAKVYERQGWQISSTAPMEDQSPTSPQKEFGLLCLQIKSWARLDVNSLEIVASSEISVGPGLSTAKDTST
jgi:hypothetical protein